MCGNCDCCNCNKDKEVVNEVVEEVEQTEIPDYIKAHKFSANHKAQLEKDEVCGCFFCLKIYNPQQIEDWIADKRGTAVCPHCGIDSVIGESSGYPITYEFLKKMKKHWFE